MKRILALVLSIVLVMAVLPTMLVSAAYFPTMSYSGTCGENIVWNLNIRGVLTISGIGSMEDFEVISDGGGENSVNAPWFGLPVKSVVIENGVTSIGDLAFLWSTLTSITIPDSVISVGKSAFVGCEGLTSITIPDSVIWIGDGAFSDCKYLDSITIPDGVIVIGNYAFSMCTSLTDITIPDSVTNIGEGAFNYTELTVYGAAGSYAEQYANYNDIPFVTIVNAPNCELGNVDGKDGVTANDALLALQAATGKIDLDDTAKAAADVDGADGITANDALVILQYATKKITAFPKAG